MNLLSYQKVLPKELVFKIATYDGNIKKYFDLLKYYCKLQNNNSYDTIIIFNNNDNYYVYNKFCFCKFKNKNKCLCNIIYCDDEKILRIESKLLTYEFFQEKNNFYKFINKNYFLLMKKYNMIEYVENHYYNLYRNLNTNIIL